MKKTFILWQITKSVQYLCAVDCIWNVMAHVQRPDLVFQRNGQVHLNRWWASSVDYWQSRSADRRAVIVLSLENISYHNTGKNWTYCANSKL